MSSKIEYRARILLSTRISPIFIGAFTVSQRQSAHYRNSDSQRQRSRRFSHREKEKD
jgi:hypothetical protein